MRRYIETPGRSSEVLRMVLTRMSQHPAALNPVTYAVWYEHLAGINPRLSSALEACLASGAPLDDASIERLHRAHVADVDAELAARVSGSMQQVMEQLGRSAAAAGGSASDVVPHLAAFGKALKSSDPGAIARQVEGVRASTERLQGAVESLSQQVQVSRGEIDRLRGELDRTRQEAVLCPLTHVLNRRGFDEQLAAIFSSPRGRPASLCLALIDIDHFKRINDTHGHLMGDRVLEALGRLLRDAVRTPGALAARYGGEEFALVLPGFTAREAADLVEGVRAATKTMRVRQRQTDRAIGEVTVSAGVTSARVGDDVISLVGRADEALYEAKRAGRDRIQVA